MTVAVGLLVGVGALDRGARPWSLRVAALLAQATAVGVPTLFVAVNAETIFR